MIQWSKDGQSSYFSGVSYEFTLPDLRNLIVSIFLRVLIMGSCSWLRGLAYHSRMANHFQFAHNKYLDFDSFRLLKHSHHFLFSANRLGLGHRHAGLTVEQ